MKNRDLTVDLINLPDYRAGLPIEKFNWEYFPNDPRGELKGYLAHIQDLIKEDKLKPDDLVTTFIARRILEESLRGTSPISKTSSRRIN